MRRRTFLLGSAAVLFGASCSSGDESPGGSDTATNQTLQFFQSGDANQGGGIAAMAAQYEKETGVKVEIVDIANADLPTKLKNAAQANDLPALRAGWRCRPGLAGRHGRPQVDRRRQPACERSVRRRQGRQGAVAAHRRHRGRAVPQQVAVRPRPASTTRPAKRRSGPGTTSSPQVKQVQRRPAPPTAW